MVYAFGEYLPPHRTVNGYKHKWMLGVRYSFNMSFKVFGGWDFCIQDPASAALKQRVIRDELKVTPKTVLYTV